MNRFNLPKDVEFGFDGLPAHYLSPGFKTFCEISQVVLFFLIFGAFAFFYYCAYFNFELIGIARFISGSIIFLIYAFQIGRVLFEKKPLRADRIATFLFISGALLEVLWILYFFFYPSLPEGFWYKLLKFLLNFVFTPLITGLFLGGLYRYQHEKQWIINKKREVPKSLP